MNILKDSIDYEEKIQRSRFIAYAKPVNTWQDAKEFITEISQEHKNATHNCWAYIVGDKGEMQHSSDDGEPSGTAGKPMLNALNKSELTNIVAVVTRYFGGVKLGIRGLIDAYGGVLERALNLAQIEELVFKRTLSLCTDYDFYNILKHRISFAGVEIVDTEYTDKVSIYIEVLEEKFAELIAILDDMKNQKLITELEEIL
jgi:uncharacterized YigZ family protein